MLRRMRIYAAYLEEAVGESVANKATSVTKLAGQVQRICYRLFLLDCYVTKFTAELGPDRILS